MPERTPPPDPTLTSLDEKILYYIHHAGPVFVTKLAKRLNAEPGAVKARMDALKQQGLVERVTGGMVGFCIGKRTKIKHRNHTYFDLTRAGRLLMRRGRPDLDVNLRPPWLQA